MIHWRELLFISLFLRYYSVTIAEIFAVANNSLEQELQSTCLWRFRHSARNKFLFGNFELYSFLSFSNSLMVSFENPCPFHVLVLVMRIQHSVSGYLRIMALVPDSEPVLIHGPLTGVKFHPMEKS